jgi:hypothetical protein
MNIVGSAGTMIQFSGKPHGNVDSDGEKTVVLYATKSTAKNKGFEEAINNDNYKLIINELLDPLNENFLSNILSNRPVLQGSNFDNGHTVFSKDAIGTFIDGIATFEEVVSMILSDQNTGNNSNSNINSNSNKMNKAELKQAHPNVYSEILAEGVSNERERVASWMVYQDADSKAVSEGISSGNAISSSQSHAFLVAIANKGRVADLKNDGAPAVVVAETETEEGVVTEATAKAEEIKSAFDFKI